MTMTVRRNIKETKVMLKHTANEPEWKGKQVSKTCLVFVSRNNDDDGDTVVVYRIKDMAQKIHNL